MYSIYSHLIEGIIQYVTVLYFDPQIGRGNFSDSESSDCKLSNYLSYIEIVQLRTS